MSLRDYVQHNIGCAAIQPLPEPWVAEPCTCPVKTVYGSHNVGCPRALAFRAFMRKLDSEPRPACTCGLAAMLADRSAVQSEKGRQR